MALLTCVAPVLCSTLAAAISRTNSAVFWISGTSFASIWPAPSAVFTPSAVSRLISAAAVWLRSASLRTSEATTAKPLPCSPARAASTAAFKARRSVLRAISSMMLIFSATSFIAWTVRATASPLVLPSSAALDAILSVCLALSAFC